MIDINANWCKIQKNFNLILFQLFFLLFTEKIRSRQISSYNDEIVIQVSNDVLHQISSRIFGTFVKEILNYNVIYEDITYSREPKQMTEKDKLYDTLEQIVV